MVYLHKVSVLHGLWQQTLNLTGGGNNLTFSSSRIIGQITELLDFLHSTVSGRLCCLVCCLRLFLNLSFLLLAELLVLFLDELIIGSTGLVGQQQTFAQFLALCIRIAIERMEIFLIILEDHLVQNGFLYFGVLTVALIDKEYKALDEVLLLIEVLLVFLACNLEGIHGDRMLLGI